MLAWYGFLPASLRFYLCSSSHRPCCPHPALKDVLHYSNFPHQVDGLLDPAQVETSEMEAKGGGSACAEEGILYGTGCSWSFQIKHLHCISRLESIHVHLAYMEHLLLIMEVHIIACIRGLQAPVPAQLMLLPGQNIKLWEPLCSLAQSGSLESSCLSNSSQRAAMLCGVVWSDQLAQKHQTSQ